jgi:CRP/FNR family transcriptional regulator
MTMDGDDTRGGSLQALFCRPEHNGTSLQLRAGEIAFEADAPAESVYFIHAGQVRLHQISADGVAMLLEILSPGQWFGAAALAGRATYGTRATAFVPTTVTRVPAKAVIASASATPDAASLLIRELASQLVSASDDAARLVFDDCNARLIKTLLRFSSTSAASPRNDADGGGVVLHITHEHLAEALGVARETVSLALTQLRRHKVLQTGRNKLVFNPEVLRTFQGSGAGKKAPLPAADVV